MKALPFSFISLALLGLAGTALALPHAASVDEALTMAKEQNRSVLLDLTGKDWCPACIHLETKILGSEVLNKAVGSQYVVVEIDYPRAPEKIAAIPAEERRRREDIIKTFNVRGLPCLIYLDSSGLPYAIEQTVTRTPEEYLPVMAKAEETRAARDAALERAAAQEGMDKARSLAAALELLPEPCQGQYRAVLAEIRALDPQDTLGYAQVVEREERRLAQLNAWEEHLKTFTKGLSGSPAEPENVSRLIAMCEEYLRQPGLIAEVQQLVAVVISEGYALQRNVPMVYATLHRALRMDESSDRARRLRSTLRYYDDFLLDELNVREAALKAAAPYLPPAPATTNKASETAPANTAGNETGNTNTP